MAAAVAVSLIAAMAACERFGFDLLPLDENVGDTGTAGDGGGLGGDGGDGGDGGASAGSGGSGAPDTGGTGGVDGSGGAGADGSGGVGGDIDSDGGGIGGDASVGGASAGGAGGATTDGGTTGGSGGIGGSSAGDGGAGGSSPLPSCDDGLQNGDEIATDCGGSECAPCPCIFGTAELLGNPNYTGNQLWSPSLSQDGLTLYVGVVVPGVSEQVMVATRPNRGNTFGLANPLPAPVNQSVEGTPHISLDGLTLYFFSERGGSGSAARNIYRATRATPSGNFNNATALTTVNSSSMDHLPHTSADELTLYFASQRGGNVDIWRSTRATRSDAFGAPSPVTEINSTADDNGMTLSLDQRTIIFASARPNGAGSYDLYQSVRASTSDPFSTPEPLTTLNTSASETDPELSRDGQELFFVSTRNGGATEIWRSLRTCP